MDFTLIVANDHSNYLMGFIKRAFIFWGNPQLSSIFFSRSLNYVLLPSAKSVSTDNHRHHQVAAIMATDIISMINVMWRHIFQFYSNSQDLNLVCRFFQTKTYLKLTIKLFLDRIPRTLISFSPYFSWHQRQRLVLVPYHISFRPHLFDLVNWRTCRWVLSMNFANIFTN